MGLEQYKAEPCVFRRLVDDRVALMVGVHVDDIVVSGKEDDCNKFLEELRQRFPVKNEGELSVYTSCAFQEIGDQVSWR